MKKIFIIDDEIAFAESLKATLDPNKYEIVVAHDGEEAFQKLETFTPDGILLDIKMPKMDGLTFLKKVNEKYGKGMIPVLITSNNSSLDVMSEGVELGIRGYIVKATESLGSLSESVDRMFPAAN